ncbi:uncharacterized protein LOC111781367 [Cucurbita pepo subsp. pepo]|uniref:uncharacterized protein LOC111781367 n=1 Tax=Cucurbita pepo subsp. pepo TaxID=3664 RepID=UPI000C9D539B|nr:uncharacterized protein LOC111781367 [Cucurbita pepo subsp. pepo]
MDDMASYFPPPPLPSRASGLEAPHYPYYQVPPSSSPPSLHYLVQQPPTFASYGFPFLPHAASINEVRTLFIAGLPEDVKPREIYNLFREFPGYESSHLRSPSQTTQPFAFAVFSDQQSAIGAMHAVNDTACSPGALNHLQGTILYSSPPGERRACGWSILLQACYSLIC